MGSIDDLRATEQELIAAIRDLAEKERQAAIKQEAYNALHGVGPNGPMPASSVSYWQQKAKETEEPTKATGGATSLIRSALSASGAGSLAGASTGLAGVGVAGLAFGANAISGALQRQEDIKQAGRDAVESAPLNESPLATKFRKDQATKLAKIDAEENDFFANSRILFSQSERDTIKSANVEERRLVNRETEQFNVTTQGIEARVEKFFAPFAQGGAVPSRDDIRSVANFFKTQVDTSYRIHADVQDVVSAIQASTPGRAGQQGKR